MWRQFNRHGHREDSRLMYALESTSKKYLWRLITQIGGSAEDSETWNYVMLTTSRPGGLFLDQCVTMG